MKNILVVQLARLGDFLQTLPLLRRLGADHRITLILSFDPGDTLRKEVDELLVVDPASLARATGQPRLFLKRLRSSLNLRMDQLDGRWDEAICLNEDRAAIALARLLVKGPVYGMGAASNPYGAWLSALSTARRSNQLHLSEIMHAACQLVPDPPEAAAEASQGDIILHPGSGSMARQLPIQFWADLCSELLGRCSDCRVLFTGSPAEESLIKAIFAQMPHTSQAVNLCGGMHLDELILLMDDARLVIAQDTGILHLAAARRRPVLGLYHGSAWYAETGPWLQGARVIQSIFDCGPCLEGRPDCDDYTCRQVFKAEQVAAIALADRQVRHELEGACLLVAEADKHGIVWRELAQNLIVAPDHALQLNALTSALLPDGADEPWLDRLSNHGATLLHWQDSRGLDYGTSFNERWQIERMRLQTRQEQAGPSW
jgi:ADP-heptose:LPS heptosyltransferase